jgi:hypothetical protein
VAVNSQSEIKKKDKKMKTSKLYMLCVVLVVISIMLSACGSEIEVLKARLTTLENALQKPGETCSNEVKWDIAAGQVWSECDKLNKEHTDLQVEMEGLK